MTVTQLSVVAGHTSREGSRQPAGARRCFAVASRVQALLLVLVALLWQAPPAAGQGSATPAARPPLSVAVFLSSRTDQCYDNGIAAAIEHLTKAERDRLNTAGGVLGRQIELQFLDDAQDDARAVANMNKALANPNTVAMIGISQTARAEAVFKAAGADIGKSGIPFLSDISVSSVFEKHGNVYTMRPSQDDDRVPVMAAFIKARHIERAAFVGLKDQLFSSSLGDGLQSSDEISLVADHRLTLKKNALDPAEIAKVVEDLKQKNPDLLILAIGTARTPEVLAALTAAGTTPSILVTGRIEALIERSGKEYPGDIFQLAWDNLPEIFSDRLRERITRNGLERWIFEGTKVPEAPGWKTDECKLRPEATPDVFDSRNMLAIGRGTQYADMIALIADALKSGDSRATTAGLRAHMLKQLETTYAAGRGAFRGSFENWSFRPDSRAADRPPFIIMRPRGLGASQLAPTQFVRLRTGTLRKIDTLYLDVDMIRTYRVDDNDKSFFADFYLSLRGNNASIKNLEFVNGFLDPKTNDHMVTSRALHEAGPSEVFPPEMNIYLVSGKFTYEPRLSGYPFDTQRFSINIQAKPGSPQFIVQPPPASLRNKSIDADGWTPRDQYVAYDQDFVPTIDAWTYRQSIVPFYKASYVWIMQRQTTDYFLRVVVPLAFILAVAYASIFIPMSHFEAIVTIQVTALLSAVALYLALPKVDANDGTTMSDRIFLFSYSAVTLMIVLSILRSSRLFANARWIAKFIGLLHVVLIPALVAAMTFYVYRASLGNHGG